MKKLKLICTCLVMFILASCEHGDSAPATVHYRFIQQVTAYHDDGSVSYHDFIADVGVAAYSEGRVSFDLVGSAGDERIELALRFEGDLVVISVGDVETRGGQNTWIRLRRPSSDSFGSNTECEIWVGSRNPSDDELNDLLNRTR